MHGSSSSQKIAAGSVSQTFKRCYWARVMVSLLQITFHKKASIKNFLTHSCRNSSLRKGCKNKKQQNRLQRGGADSVTFDWLHHVRPSSHSIFVFSHFRIFAFSYFPISAFSYFCIFAFSYFRIFEVSYFRIFAFAHFRIFVFSHFSIFRISTFSKCCWKLIITKKMQDISFLVL